MEKPTTVEHVLTYAMVNAAFQEKLFTDPEAVAREAGLDEEDVRVLKALNPETFSAFIKEFNEHMGSIPIVQIFCIYPT